MDEVVGLTEVVGLIEAVGLTEEDLVEAGAAEVVLTDKTLVLQIVLLHWESSCIHVKMILCVSVQQRKTKFPTSMPQCIWKTRSRLGRWTRYLASYGIFIFQSNFVKI